MIYSDVIADWLISVTVYFRGTVCVLQAN